MANAIRYPYKVRHEGRAFPFKRPFLPITLASAQAARTLDALVDTGADVSMLPHAVGIELGLVWSDHPSGGTISGGFRTSEIRLVRIGLAVAGFPVVEVIFG